MTDDVYNALAARKNGRSFTRVIADLLEKTKPKSLRDLAGTWVGDDEEAEQILEQLMADRHRSQPDRVVF